MNILAIDTSSYSMSVSIMVDGRLIGESNINNGLVHSVQFMPSLKNLFDLLEYDKKDLDLIAVAVGPGSFTGIRIGVSSANAMSIALNIPVVSVCSLDALAYNASHYQGNIITTIDAQKETYYSARYKFEEGNLKRLSDYEIKSKDEIMALDDSSKVILGDYHSKNIMDLDNFIRGAYVAQIGEKIYLSQNYEKYAKPFYIRKSHAEVEYEKRHKS